MSSTEEEYMDWISKDKMMMWGANNGEVTFIYHTIDYMEMHFDEWGQLDKFIDKRPIIIKKKSKKKKENTKRWAIEYGYSEEDETGEFVVTSSEQCWRSKKYNDIHTAKVEFNWICKVNNYDYVELFEMTHHPEKHGWDSEVIKDYKKGLEPIE